MKTITNIIIINSENVESEYLLTVVISDLPNLLVSYKISIENKKQLAFHVSWC